MTPRGRPAPDGVVSWLGRTECLRRGDAPTRRYQIFTSPRGAGEPSTRKDAGALYSDVVAALRYLAEMIDQRLKFGAFRGVRSGDVLALAASKPGRYADGVCSAGE
jgi:hypothetical protein